ncbi:efflux transporter periplasmic adaptor subunit [Phyllobacterium brassicacearum]|uniref:Efflux transporter periplasmic adaptor subunit n=1 Tax=Phyllobacterium brassicacearum TaxID=314235 RepID=A0A2P7B904_9HYPH|nr:efflux RND transporter periplasmic adaptor subunit [Phyllobacterium brassicacearum]PSH62928.1 efflux transporter periplasmic adaptor subunit [Phyllobacterium brassicacearum]TDQ13656.1 Cu(I)/Ag(I) efflux system membrane fusion protein [Phyllobacterium brassicacearum]
MTSRITSAFLTLVAISAAGAGGYYAGSNGFRVEGLALSAPATSVAAPAASGPVIYYRDPDGKPFYAATLRKTADGRDFLPVLASEDVSFDGQGSTSGNPSAPDPNPAVTSENKKVLYYRNPMGLPDTSPVPKKDSMGMDYLPVYDGEDNDDGKLKISLGKMQRTGVRSEQAASRVLTVPVRAPGTIQLDERRISVVATRSDAFIEKVADITTGDKVKKGQDLVRLYSPDIATAGAQYVTELSDPVRRSVLGGARQRLENLGAHADLIKEIERTRKVPLAVPWTASQDGVVLERNAIDGMKAAPGDVLFRIADVSTVWALADIADRDLPRIATGQNVTVRVRGFDDRTFAGKVSQIYPQVNKETRTTRVRVELANRDGILRPDMYVEAEIATGSEQPVTSVPASAVLDSGMRQIVLIDKGEGRFEPRVVTVGRRNTDYVEIREGITPGDDVVVAANFLIDAESNLKAALRGLAPDTPKPDQPGEKPL